eukprot:763042-Hanusia_phi.AAC.8
MPHKEDCSSSLPPIAFSDCHLAERDIDLSATGVQERDEGGDLQGLFFHGKDSIATKAGGEPSRDSALGLNAEKLQDEMAAFSSRDCVLNPEENNAARGEQEVRMQGEKRADDNEPKRRRTCKIQSEKFRRRSLFIECHGEPGKLLNNVLVAVEKVKRSGAGNGNAV